MASKQQSLPTQKSPAPQRAAQPTPVGPQDQTSSSGAGHPQQPASVTIPRIAQPSGGGALRGMGEKISADPSSGTCSLSIPIQTSPARACTPHLALTYSSGGGNGPFGLGWGLAGLGNITRRTDKGLPRYEDERDSDVFILSGCEDLVPRPGSPVEKSDAAGIAYLVRRYRPRTEAEFSRIEKWTNKTDAGDVFWRVTGRDNTTSVFGRDDASRICHAGDADGPPGPKRIFSWLLCETYDSSGNAVLYTYKAEDSAGADLAAAHEQDRTESARAAQRYIKSIRYGNRTPNRDLETWMPLAAPLSSRRPQDWAFEVVFDYGEHPAADPTPEPAVPWACRQDPFSAFRSSFEVRTYRLCRRVLLFHRFPEAPVLVSSLDLDYDERSTVSLLVRATSRGYILRSTDPTLPAGPGLYFSKAMPPVDLRYTSPPTAEGLKSLEVRDVDDASAQNLPYGVSDTLEWLDLFGEGLPGILANQHGGWFYKQNLSTMTSAQWTPSSEDSEAQCSVVLGAMSSVSQMPNLGDETSLHFADLAGDGATDLAVLRGPAKGFYEVNRDAPVDQGAQWLGFKPFVSFPVEVDLDDPSCRFVDVTGDGRADILIAQDNVFTYYPSLGTDGFGGPQRVAQWWADEAQAPRLVFADGEEAIYFTDMTGDGTLDVCRIRNTSICYWPHLGYGRFGRRVTMDGAPVFHTDAEFDKRRIVLADVDGSGTTDIIYVRPDSASVFFNEAGNAWSPGHALPAFLPPVDSLSHIASVDLLGTGTTCLVWSSTRPGAKVRYVDFNRGTKPHLLAGVDNNIGAETRMSYLPSTTFYRRDCAGGRPWATRMPHPVQCLERTEVYDAVRRSFASTRYAYHHGYYDAADREFRGFGAVEQWDTEEFGALSGAAKHVGASSIDRASYAPPVLTKRWYHTGAYLDHGRLQRQYAKEYFGGGGLSGEAFEAFYAKSVVQDVIEGSAALTGAAAREASRSLRGALLREEVYALDGTDAERCPFHISDTGHTIRMLQLPDGNHADGHGVCLTYARESITHTSERAPDDARVEHQLVLEVDDFGNTKKSVHTWYGRTPGKSDLEGVRKDLQEETRQVYTEAEFTNAIDSEEIDAYRTPCPSGAASYELTGFAPPHGERTSSRGEDIFTNSQALIKDIGDVIEVPFETARASTGRQKRLLSRSAILYRKDDLSGPCEAGIVESMALAWESRTLCLTSGALAGYTRDGEQLIPSTSVLEGCGYVRPPGDDGWWIPSDRAYYAKECAPDVELEQARSHFFQPVYFVDAAGHPTEVGYDGDWLLLTSLKDALDNRVACEYDRRTLQPSIITDENDNRTAFAYDGVGQLVAQAVMGKAGERVGDTLDGIRVELAQQDLEAFAADPVAHGRAVLGSASTRFVYDLGRWQASRGTAPAFTAKLARDTHAHDEGADKSKVHVAFTYADGLGREMQMKLLVAPGPAAPAQPRWAGSMWQVLSNKGLPVRTWKPFFDGTHEYRADAKVGACVLSVYDALGRLVASVREDKSWTATVYETWRTVEYDASDTVLRCPKDDANFRHIFAHIPYDDCLPTWYDERIGGQRGRAEQLAAQKAARHANTPSTSQVNAWGVPFLRTTDNGGGELFTAAVVHDITGFEKQVYDVEGRLIQQHAVDMLGRPIHASNMESGDRWLLHDARGNVVRTWDGRGQTWRDEFDARSRRVTSHLTAAGARHEILFARTAYGETARGDPKAHNLRGRLYEEYSQAGVERAEAYDFAGNLVDKTLELAEEFAADIDWADPAAVPRSPPYRTRAAHDAMGKVLSSTTPDGSTIQYSYDESGLVSSVAANLKGEKDAGGRLLWKPYVTRVQYNAFLKPTVIGMANGSRTVNTYDPLTDRLTERRTARAAGNATSVYEHLEYVYDPVGNIVAMHNKTAQDLYFRNQVVTPDADYTYDPAYRLIRASGREHIGQTGGRTSGPYAPGMAGGGGSAVSSVSPNDGNAMTRYTETYTYSAAGNMLSLNHRNDDGKEWTRSFEYREPSPLEPGSYSNRLSASRVGAAAPDTYAYDGPGGAHGCMTSMPHLTAMAWGPLDQLRATSRQRVRPGGGGAPETTWHTYGSGMDRARKVTVRTDAETSASRRRKLKVRIYVGSYEIYRKYAGDGATVAKQCETLRIGGGGGGEHALLPVVVVEDWTGGARPPGRLARWQVSDHQQSVSVEVDDAGKLVSYEEYTPYGDTSYHLAAGRTPKRFRWVGKERDKESGLYYCQHRFYAPWLCRWTATDPLGIAAGPNLYEYAGSSPVVYSDPTGLAGEKTGKTGDPPDRLGKRDNMAHNRDCDTKDAATGQAELRKQRKAEPKTQASDSLQAIAAAADAATVFGLPKDSQKSRASIQNGIIYLKNAMQQTKPNEIELHHVYPTAWKDFWREINIDRHSSTIPLNWRVHYTIENVKVGPKGRTWQEWWNRMFFNNTKYTDLIKDTERNAEKNATLRAAARKTAAKVMAKFGFQTVLWVEEEKYKNVITHVSPVPTKEKQPGYVAVSAFVHYNIRNQHVNVKLPVFELLEQGK